MAERDSFQLAGNAPQIYEEQHVPALFRPLAEATLRQVHVPEGARVIDVACGTGIVGRLVAEKVGRSGTVIGVDLNGGMIETAKQNSPMTGANVEWRQGDVNALPFPDTSFDIAFCQQGLQFFPDKLVALKELRRVLAPGGAMILTVWSAIPPSAAAQSVALAKYVGAAAAKSSLAPFSFRDHDVIKALMVEAGFKSIQMETLVVERLIGPAEESMPRRFAASPYANDVAKLDRAIQDALDKEIDEALQKYRVDDRLAIPHETHLIRATA